MTPAQRLARRDRPIRRLTTALALVLLAISGASRVVAQPEEPKARVQAKLTYRMVGEPDGATLAGVIGVIEKRLARLGVEGSAVEAEKNGHTFTVRIPDCTRAGLSVIERSIRELGWLHFAIEANEEELADPERGLGPKFDRVSFYKKVQDRVEKRRAADPKRFDPVTYTGEATALYANPKDWTRPAQAGDEPRFWFYPPKRWTPPGSRDVRGPMYGAIVHVRPDMCFAGDTIEETYPSTKGFEQVIFFAVREDAKNAFFEFTKRNMKRNLCVILNHYLITRPVIQSALPGAGIIEGIGERDEVRALIVAIKTGKLSRRISLVNKEVSGSGGPAAPTPAGHPADIVAASLDEADRRLATWDVPGAWAAALRAGYLVEREAEEPPSARRAYLTLARVAIRRGAVHRSRSFFLRAAACRHGLSWDLRSIADGVALCVHPMIRPSNPRLEGHLHPEFLKALSPDAVEIIEGLGPDADRVTRYVRFAIRAAFRIARETKEPGFALHVLAEANRSLDRHAHDVSDSAGVRAWNKLAERIRHDAGHRASFLLAEVERLEIETDPAGIPVNSGLAFALGRCSRALALVTARVPEPGPDASEGEALAHRKGLAPAAIQANLLSAWSRYMAQTYFWRCIETEPDHLAASVALAGFLFRAGREDDAFQVMERVTRNLLEPARAWRGEPVLPAAPRYLIAQDAIDLIAIELGGRIASPKIPELDRTVGHAQIAPYLELGPRFHPEDTVAYPHPIPDTLDNNIGFNLMREWDLTRAAQLFRRGIRTGQRRKDGRGPMPIILHNLGHLHYLVGDFESSLERYRESSRLDPRNAVAWNNLGALMGIFGSMTLNHDLIREAHDCYERAAELAPDYVYARSSRKFMKKVVSSWDRYLNQEDRSPSVVYSFANSFLFAARSVSESDDPKYLQALEILDRGLRALPPDDELAKIFADFESDASAASRAPSPSTVKERMGKLFRTCFDGGRKKYASLLARYGADNPHLNYLAAEVCRLGWRRWGRAPDRDAALAGYARTLAAAPAHVAAGLARSELLQTLGREGEAIRCLEAVVTELLKPWKPWDGEPTVEPAPRFSDVERLAMTAAARFPGTEAWRAFRTRTVARFKAAVSGKPRPRRL